MKTIACASLLLVLGSACGSGSHPTSTPPTGSSTVAPGPSSTTALGPRVSVRIDLTSASMVAGSSETGHLVIENHTGGPLRLTTGGPNACRPKWSVVLANGKLPQRAAFTKECGPGALVVPAGETRLAFTLQANFQACNSTGQAQGALIPTCRRGPHGLTVAPPLPPDRYRATFFGDIAQFASVPSVPVQVGARA